MNMSLLLGSLAIVIVCCLLVRKYADGIPTVLVMFVCTFALFAFGTLAFGEYSDALHFLFLEIIVVFGLLVVTDTSLKKAKLIFMNILRQTFK